MSDDVLLEVAGSGPGLPDRVLRSALELAVGIAATGAKLRPPLPFPAGLKPYLRFQKLPPAALANVRAAVEGDDDFRQRLSTVASDDLVDEVGRLWLARPEGWQTAAAALVEQSRPAVDAAGELRRERRRREAAEAATSRARLDLVALREQLEAERAARQVAQAEVDRSASELASMHSRLAESQRSANRRTSKLAASDADLTAMQGELVSLREALDDAVRARDAALADRAVAHTGGSADLERVRALLVEALAVTRPAEPRTRRRVRKPIPVPGGIYGNSEAAAEHLLRAPDVVVLVDGYNVAKLGWPSLSLEQQRARCIDAAENLARRWGTLLHVVFDGAAIVGATAQGRRLVRVSYSPEGVLADDVLRAEVVALDADRPVVVVTNDQAVLADVRAAGANTVASDVFVALARR